MFKDLYQFLKMHGFEVHSIGQKQDLCNNPYLVIFESDPEETSFKSLEKTKTQIWVFYPFGRYSEIDGFINSVESAIKKYKKLRKIGKRSAIKIDDEIKAYYCSLDYYRFCYKGGKK